MHRVSVQQEMHRASVQPEVHQYSAQRVIHRVSVHREASASRIREASVRRIREVSASHIRAAREIPYLHRRQGRMEAIPPIREITVIRIRDITIIIIIIEDSVRPAARAETSAEIRMVKEVITIRAVTETTAARVEEMQEAASEPAMVRPEEQSAVMAEEMTEIQLQHH